MSVPYPNEMHKALVESAEKLQVQLEAKERELRIAENRSRGWNPKTCRRLQSEIESLNRRLEFALDRLEKKPPADLVAESN